jgi:hypothetical protein
MTWRLYSHLYKYLGTFKDIPVPHTKEWVVFEDGLYQVMSVWYYLTQVRVVAVKMDFPPPGKMRLRKPAPVRR